MFSFLKNILGSGAAVDSAIVQPDAVFIDVRSKAEFASGHLEGAKNIPLELIQSNAELIKGFPQSILYCRSGNRSSHAVHLLNAQGLTHVVDGGSLFSAQELVNASGHFSVGIVKESQQNSIPSAQSEPVKMDKSLLKVLIPTDFSVQADFSYLMVKKLEEHFTIELHFLHVLDVPDTVTMNSKGEIETCGEIDVAYVIDQKKIAEEKLKQLQVQYGSHIKTHFLLGKITDTTKAFAEENQFDLIVMGTKGSWGIKEKLSTTQAQIISRKCNVPLLSLMCDRSDLEISHVLFVNDFSKETNVQVTLAEKFAAYFEAHFTLLHLVKEHNLSDRSIILDRMDDFAREQGIKNYEKIIAQTSHVESGVNEFLKSKDADIVFIGTHDYSGFIDRAAAESLIKHVFKPIITVHL